MDAYLWNLYSWKIKHVGFECVLFFVEFVRCNSFIQTQGVDDTCRGTSCHNVNIIVNIIGINSFLPVALTEIYETAPDLPRLCPVT